MNNYIQTKKKVALLFGCFPNENYSEVISNSKGGIQNAADALQKSLIEGLGSLCLDLNIINLPYLGSYPKRYKSLFTPKGRFSIRTQLGNVIEGRNIVHCNLTGYKMLDRYLKAKSAIIDWCNINQEEEKVIIVYAMHLPFLKACVNVKKNIKGSLKIILIVPDLPQYMGGSNSFPYSYLNKLNRQKLYKACEEVDGFVLLSKYMAETLPVGKKPWTLVEGIFNNVADDVKEENISSARQVFYAGTLAKRYGVMNLVKAFHKIQNDFIELVICGAGDAELEIEQMALNDNRIKFKGQLPREEVLKLQQKATLLVNPRTPEGEFTKYSFPSKTMEYFASGKPTLLYRLPGIPDEYFEHCYTVDVLGIDALSESLSCVLNLSNEKLEQKGRSARNFVLSQKNPIVQCSKIVQLISKI